MTPRQKIGDNIFPARNISIDLSFLRRVSVAKLYFHANFCEVSKIVTLFSNIADFRTF